MHEKKNERGFTYIDVMIAIFILMIGILALVAALTAGVVRMRQDEQQMLSKLYASSTLESVFSARDVNTLGWDAIGNVGNNVVNGTAQGIFLTGQQPLRASNGSDHIVGTADDTGTVVPGFTRQIVITDICDPDRPSANCATSGPFPVMMRQIQVTVTYQIGSVSFQNTETTIMTNY